MDLDTLKEFTENILDGETLGDTLFGQLVNIARVRRENMRKWQILVKEDSSNQVTSATTYETNISLPSDFRRMYRNPKRPALILVSTSNANDVLKYEELPLQMRRMNKDKPGFFVVDHLNSRLHVLGTVSGTYTMYLYYIHDPTDIDSDTQWIFPSEFHPILGFDVAAMHRGGIDFDDINARLAENNRADAAAIWDAMVKWDDQLARSALGM